MSRAAIARAAGTWGLSYEECVAQPSACTGRLLTMSNRETFKFVTGTATFAIFDPALLGHRFNDAADWWSVPWDEVAEINRGNMLTVALGSDGAYTVHFSSEPFSGAPHLQW